jgi:hypothetical protein
MDAEGSSLGCGRVLAVAVNGRLERALGGPLLIQPEGMYRLPGVID